MWKKEGERSGKDQQLKYTFKRTNHEFEHIEIKEEIREKWKVKRGNINKKLSYYRRK